MGDLFDYGYYIRGEKIVLGSVDQFHHDEKNKEIQSANFISGGGTGQTPDHTTWFIDPLTLDARSDDVIRGE